MSERRAWGQVQHDAGQLSGVAIRYGDVSKDFQEKFLPGAFVDLPASIAINLQHDRALEIIPSAELNDTAEALSVRASLPENSGVRALVKRGALSGLSIEFKPLDESVQDGIRVIERASLEGLALVDRGAYGQSKVQVRRRRGRTLRTRIPYDRPLACDCSGANCNMALFEKSGLAEAMAEVMQSAIDSHNKSVLATRSNYSEPVASVRAGSVRASKDGQVEIDLPEGAAGDAILRDVEDTQSVLIRPFIDRENQVSEVVDMDGQATRKYSKFSIRSFIIGATDRVNGWEPATVEETPERLMRVGHIGGKRVWF